MAKKKNIPAKKKYQNKPFTDVVAREIAGRFEKNHFTLCTLKAGTGKTFIAIHTAGLLNPKTHMVIIAPTAKTQDGSWGASIDAYNEAMGTSITYDSTTFDKLKNDTHRAPIMNKIKDAEYVLLIFDEIHMIKKATSKRAIAAIDLARNTNINKVIGLSATAVPNNPFDACTYLILNGDYKDQTAFRNAHAVRYNEYYVPIFEGEHDLRNKEHFDTLMKNITVHVEASELLPDVKNYYHTVKLSDTGKYIEPLFNTEKHPFEDDEARTSLGHYKKALWYKQKGWYESSAEGVNILSSIIAKDANRKMMLYLILKHHFAQKDAKPVIIGYRLNIEREMIEIVCEKLGIDMQYINGKEKNMTKPANNKTAILLQYQAGGAGIELPFAPTTIFYTPTFSYQDLEQTKGRNVRSGMTETVQHHYITTDNKRDFKIWKVVFNKEEVSLKFHDMCDIEEYRKYL